MRKELSKIIKRESNKIVSETYFLIMELKRYKTVPDEIQDIFEEFIIARERYINHLLDMLEEIDNLEEED